jgi:hypothetical protein
MPTTVQSAAAALSLVRLQLAFGVRHRRKRVDVYQLLSESNDDKFDTSIYI